MDKPQIVDELNALFEPRSVAVIGATNDMSKWGFSTFASLKGRYKGDLYAVNNRDTEVLGHKAYDRVTDVPGPVDLSVFVIPPDQVAGAMQDCVEKGVKASVIITAGFAETGASGKAMQDEVMAIAKRGGIRVVGPNCMGMWSAAAELTAFMFPLPITEGPLALVSQGGNVGGALVIDATSRGVGFQQYVSCGAAADIRIEDYVEYFAADEKVKVIMVYIEGLSDGKRFVEKVGRITPEKPVIALKPGRTTAAAKAISSHSGAMSGSDSVYQAAFKKAGVIRVDNGMEMLDLAIGLLNQPLPRGRSVVIATPGGSYGVMAADACACRGLEVIELPEKAMEEFNRVFPERWSHGNPVDPAGDRNFVTYLKAPQVILEQPEVDALIFMGFGSFSGISSVLASAGGEDNPRMKTIKRSMEGLGDMARSSLAVLDSGDREGIKNLVKVSLSMIFGAVMVGDSRELDEFLDTLSDALTSGKTMEGGFMQGLRRFFKAIAEGDLDNTELAAVLELTEPMLDALISHWIEKHQKPVIITTFTEESLRISPSGHYPYSNADRAANVLAKLVEYREYLDKADERKEEQLRRKSPAGRPSRESRCPRKGEKRE